MLQPCSLTTAPEAVSGHWNGFSRRRKTYCRLWRQSCSHVGGVLRKIAARLLTRIFRKLTVCTQPALINTPLQRGVVHWRPLRNRFNGFSAPGKPLKRFLCVVGR